MGSGLGLSRIVSSSHMLQLLCRALHRSRRRLGPHWAPVPFPDMPYALEAYT